MAKKAKVQSFHILNGDALLERFPKEITGKRIVARDCLVEGNVVGKHLDEFYQNRIHFLSQHYPITKESYQKDTVAEIQKIQAIPHQSKVYFWFEDDLFCQVNWWFVLNLFPAGNNYEFFLVRPKELSQYGFGAYKQNQLIELFQAALQIVNIRTLQGLWPAYSNQDLPQLHHLAKSLPREFAFVGAAVEAHLARQESKESIGKPKAVLLDIIDENGTDDFGLIYQKFSQQLPIYGFGDWQVKRLLEELMSKTK